MMDRNLKVPADASPPTSKSREVVHDPTPEEIAAACEEIQSRWSEEERMIRARGINRHLPDDK